MKKTKLLMLGAAIFVLLLPLGQALAQGQEDAKFQKILETYLDEYWKFYPTQATVAGYYKYNDKLEDPSQANVDKRDEIIKKINSDIIKLDRSKLSPENQQALNILFDYIDLEFVKLENLLPWDYNPLFYNEIIITGLHSLLTKEFAPADSRVRSATERLKALPNLIKRAKDNLKTPAQIYTEIALKQMPHIINFYKNEAPTLAASASDPVKQAFLAELNRAVPLLEDYQRYLRSELLPKSTGNFRLGPEVHRRLIQRLSGSAISQEELANRAQADVKNIRREMFLVCIPLHKMMYPEVDIEQLQGDPDTIWNRIIKNVFDKIKVFHPTREALVNKVAASAESLKKFGQESKLFPVPTEPLEIKPMPGYFAGLSRVRLTGPGAYDTQGKYAVEIATMPDDWSEQKAKDYLEEYNNFYLEVMTAQRVFPGSFVPVVSTRKSSSLITRLFPNPALLLGWPIYVQQNLIYAGYGDYDPRLRLNQLKLMLKTVMDFQMDLNIHQGGITKEQFMRYLTVTGFQTEAEAERTWEYLVLNPGSGALPYVGLQEILDLEKDVQRTKGQAFDRSDFITKLISNGALPPIQLRSKVIN
ncbi:MAG: DUF885 family protein [Candidatus Saccharicenans sp.]|jgi:uncharacterized protein (DUF885 family)|nr:DUF885 domain-containing protein [Candidatus Saccharicenans sp.]MDH7574432.1 DUF885 family protein [Candidatus Saccharicenans sp.]